MSDSAEVPGLIANLLEEKGFLPDSSLEKFRESEWDRLETEKKNKEIYENSFNLYKGDTEIPKVNTCKLHAKKEIMDEVTNLIQQADKKNQDCNLQEKEASSKSTHEENSLYYQEAFGLNQNNNRRSRQKRFSRRYSRKKLNVKALNEVMRENQFISSQNYYLRSILRCMRERTGDECCDVIQCAVSSAQCKCKNGGSSHRKRRRAPCRPTNPGGSVHTSSWSCGGYTPSGMNKMRVLKSLRGGSNKCFEEKKSKSCDSFANNTPPGSASCCSSGGGASPTNRPSTRILGEMAFQLERRILDYVFGNEDGCKRRRFYGYTMGNVRQMMKKESHGPEGGFDRMGKDDMTSRLKKILSALEKFGYDINVHADFAQEVINKYGLLPCPPDQCTIQTFGLNDPYAICCMIDRLCRGVSEATDLKILLRCLTFLSNCDGRPLFVW